jgi:hypothetical protein
LAVPDELGVVLYPYPEHPDSREEERGDVVPVLRDVRRDWPKSSLSLRELIGLNRSKRGIRFVSRRAISSTGQKENVHRAHVQRGIQKNRYRSGLLGLAVIVAVSVVGKVFPDFRAAGTVGNVLEVLVRSPR